MKAVMTYGLLQKEDDLFSKKHREYANRVYSDYEDEGENYCTNMPKFKFISYSRNPKFIKSVLCHPHMPDKVFSDLSERIKASQLLDVFKGRSVLFKDKL